MGISVAACGGAGGSSEKTDSSAAKSTAQEAATESAASEEPAFTTPESAIVSTAYGKVQGADYGEYTQWLGVPYAAAPTGELRWAAPQDPEAWTQTLDCTKAGNVAIQAGTDAKTGETVVNGSEDCLNLDIYAKKGAENLPVLVYIHGGNNQTGQSAEIPGQQITVRDDCVYVSLNYRLGVLGFNCLPALQSAEGSTGNYALLDIAKSLDWIKENIAAFGGDPANVTISGFSAGGRDVMAMLASPLFAGKFQKAIAFSGGMTMADPTASAKKIAEAIAPLAVEDGKAKDEAEATAWLQTSGTDVRDYLYSIDADRLAVLMANAGIRMSVFPHLFEDGVVLPQSGFDTTAWNSVPVMMLTGSTEFSFFNNFDPYYSTLKKSEQPAAIQFGFLYGSEMYRIFNTQESARKMEAEGYSSPIYLCQIDYGGQYSQSKIEGFGAFHGIFVPMLSDVNGYTGIYDFQSQKGYQAMGEQYNRYLANFLSTGDPNGEELPDWPAWTSAEPKTQVFDAGKTADSVKISSEDVSTTYDEIMAEMDKDDTLTQEQKAGVISNVMNGRWFSDALDAHYGNKSLW